MHWEFRVGYVRKLVVVTTKEHIVTPEHATGDYFLAEYGQWDMRRNTIAPARTRLTVTVHTSMPWEVATMCSFGFL